MDRTVRFSNPESLGWQDLLESAPAHSNSSSLLATAQGMHPVKLGALKTYLDSDETHERIALGLPLKQDRADQLDRRIEAVKTQIGEVTITQQLAGEAALKRLGARANGPSPQSQALHDEAAQAICSWHSEIETPATLTESAGKTLTSTVSSCGGTGFTLNTTPTSVGVHALVVDESETVRIDSVQATDSKPSKASTQRPCDSEKDLRLHREPSHPRPFLVCDICRQRFTNVLLYRAHLNKHHQSNAQELQNFDSDDLRQNRCCGHEATNLQNSIGDHDGLHSQEMPAGAWDLTALDLELPTLAKEENQMDPRHPVDGTEEYVKGNKLSDSTQEIFHNITTESHDSLSNTSSDSSVAFDLDRVVLSSWERGMICALIEEVYMQLAAEGYNTGRTHAGETQSSGTGKRNPGGVTSSKHSANKGKSQKRSRPRSSCSSRHSEDERGKKTRLNSEAYDQNGKKLGFACPLYYVRRDCQFTDHCTNKGKGWKYISTLRYDHLRDYHKFSIEKGSGLAHDDLIAAGKTTNKEKWEAMFERIYPDEKPIPPIYYDPSRKTPCWKSLEEPTKNLDPARLLDAIKLYLVPIFMQKARERFGDDTNYSESQIKSGIAEMTTEIFIEASRQPELTLELIYKIASQSETQSTVRFDAGSTNGDAFQPPGRFPNFDPTLLSDIGLGSLTGGSEFLDSGYDTLPPLPGMCAVCFRDLEKGWCNVCTPPL